MKKIACQTIVYGNPVIKDTIDTILTNVKENGYDGAEIGARHFYLDRPDYYRALFQSRGLELAAIHVGGDFLNPGSVKEQVDNIAQYIDLAKKLDVKYIYSSGTFKENKTAADYHNEARALTEVGKRCADAGLTFCFHNHNWEFWNEMLGMNILLDEVPCDVMKLVPDVGWVTRGGYNPVEFLQKNLERVEAVHFKDFNAEGGFTELGTGVVDFKGVYDFIKDKKDDLWITAEQDQATVAPEISSKANCDFIRSLLK